MQPPDILLGNDHVPQPPARHREQLGESVQHEGIVREFQGGVLLLPVHETVVDLVANHRDAQPAQGAEIVRRYEGSGGIRGGVQEDRLCAPADQVFHGIRPRLETLLLQRLHVARRSRQVLDEVGVAGIVGIPQDDLVARLFHEDREGEEERRRRAHRYEDPVFRNVRSVPLVVVGGDRRPQLPRPAAVRVMRFPLTECADGRFDDSPRSPEIGLADLQVHDGAPLALQRDRPLEHVHYDEGFDVIYRCVAHRVTLGSR